MESVFGDSVVEGFIIQLLASLLLFNNLNVLSLYLSFLWMLPLHVGLLVAYRACGSQ